MSASYPASIKTFTTKQNLIDVYDSEHINSPQEEIVAIQTELGTDVAGDQTNLKTRLAYNIKDNGALNHGTSFPVSPRDGDVFTRTDQNVTYFYSSGSWRTIQQLSNLIYCWTGHLNTNSDVSAYVGASLTTPTTKNYMYLWASCGTTYRELLASKWIKIAGVNTLTVYCQIWQGNSNTVTCKVDVGGASGSVAGTPSQTTPEWCTFTVDVSGLSNGTVYDLSVQIKQNNSNGQLLFFGAITIFGS